MNWKRVNWKRACCILALGVALVWLSLWLGRSPIGWMVSNADAQVVVPPAIITFPKPITLQDRATYTMALDQTHQVCWSDPNNPVATDIKIWRYRVEGGGRTLYLHLSRQGWQANGTIANSFCRTGISIPKAGHWIYDAALCWGTNCSDVVTASCAASVAGCAGGVGDVARGWWIYAFLPAPTGVGVN